MTTLRHGDRGQCVLALQRALNARGAALFLDGDYGEATERAVRDFQSRVGLVNDGVAGPKTQAALKGQSIDRLLKQSDIAAAARRLDVPLACVLAVNEVESGGAGFLANDKPKTLFERHVFFRQLSAAKFDVAVLAQRYPNLIDPRPGGYVGGTAEHQRLAQARAIDDTCALESASWGLFQIMGYHWKALGYESVQQFATLMAIGEGAQLDAFTRFILSEPDLHRALKARKWASFARRYNGPDYERNLYDVKLARAYERHRAAAIDEEVV
jgi:hypothetical protein